MSEQKSLSERIHNLLTDSRFLELKSKQKSDNLFKTLAASYLETWHSAFISWLLDPKSYHGLADYPLKRFLYAVWRECHEGDGAGEFELNLGTIERLNLNNMTVRTEHTADGLIADKGKARIDIYASSKQIKEGKGSLHIVIENKVKAREHGDQTEVYFNFFDRLDCEPGEIVYVFLTPRSSDAPKSKNFVRVTYQSLANDVLGPCLRHPSLTDEGKYLLTQYAANLRVPLNNGVVMALPDVELCQQIYQSHKEVLDEIFMSINKIPPQNTKRQVVRTWMTTLGNLMAENYLSCNDKLVANYNNTIHTATLHKDPSDYEPTILLNGKSFESLSQAAFQIKNKSVNGWTFWRAMDEQGNDKGLLSDLRKKREAVNLPESDEPDTE